MRLAISDPPATTVNASLRSSWPTETPKPAPPGPRYSWYMPVHACMDPLTLPSTTFFRPSNLLRAVCGARPVAVERSIIQPPPANSCVRRVVPFSRSSLQVAVAAMPLDCPRHCSKRGGSTCIISPGARTLMPAAVRIHRTKRVPAWTGPASITSTRCDGKYHSGRREQAAAHDAPHFLRKCVNFDSMRVAAVKHSAILPYQHTDTKTQTKLSGSSRLTVA